MIIIILTYFGNRVPSCRECWTCVALCLWLYFIKLICWLVYLLYENARSEWHKIFDQYFWQASRIKASTKIHVRRHICLYLQMRDRTVDVWLEISFHNLTLISSSLPVCKLRFLLVATNTLLVFTSLTRYNEDSYRERLPHSSKEIYKKLV